ncbi:MAG: hypothetical protein PHE88_12395 [Elusimicrobia bacterium]|nr:hypothetical protein [Elusimicrobiota bacterium]
MSKKIMYHGGLSGKGSTGFPPILDRLVTPLGILMLIAEDVPPFQQLRFTAVGGSSIYTDGDFMMFVAAGFDTYIDGGDSVEIDAADDLYLYSALTADLHAGTALELHAGDGTIKVPHLKSGSTQLLATAAAGELWMTVAHASLPDGVIMRGL